MSNELDKPVGTKETQKLSAGSVIVESVSIDIPKEGSKAKIVTFHCKHPDRADTIKLQNVMLRKTQGNNINIKKEALWYNEDEDGNVKKTSATATVMNFYNKNSLNAFKSTSINTELDAQGYLCIKGY